MNEAIALFSKSGNQCIPLVSTRIDGELQDLMSNITVEQTFKNTESSAIEAVYTFPLPYRGVLMNLKVKVGDRILDGVVQEASDASEQYEEAISDGDGAILLQKINEDDNLYTMNVGNIRPGETIVICFSYALLNQLQGNELRLSIPTTISPRYGGAFRAGMAPHQTPQTSLMAEHRYSLNLKIKGLFHNASVDCPTHKINKQRDGESIDISLARGSAFLDRDFVLNISPDQGVSASATFDTDFEGHAVMATFMPRLPAFDSNPRDIRIVIDCSGSMGGDSIAQARIALKSILAELHPNDVFNIILFGNSYKTLFVEPVKANKTNISHAKKLADKLDANMGGTEMGSAIRAASMMESGTAEGADILLITDGQIHEYEQIIDEIGESGHRVFSVGVGSGVAEGFIRNIASKTNGMAEFVAPNEDMARHIVRHFQRIYSPGATATLIWPDCIADLTPGEMPAIYSGDTLHVFGHSSEYPEGEVELKLVINDTTIIQRANISPLESGDICPSTLARLGANERLKYLEGSTRTDLAVQYQLMTDKTSYLVIDKREADEQSDGNPLLRKVDQMLTAGWGGTSIVNYGSFMMKIESNISDCYEFDDLIDLDDEPFGSSAEETEIIQVDETPWDDFCSAIIQILNSGEYEKLTFNQLHHLRVPTWIISVLNSMCDAGHEEYDIIHAFLYKLATLRLKGRVHKTILDDFKPRLSSSLPDGFTRVVNVLVKEIEKEMNNPNIRWYGGF